MSSFEGQASPWVSLVVKASPEAALAAAQAHGLRHAVVLAEAEEHGETVLGTLLVESFVPLALADWFMDNHTAPMLQLYTFHDQAVSEWPRNVA